MAAQRRVHSFRNDPNIAPFVVEGTVSGKLLGTGSYGSVEEVVINGLMCAGKKIHEALLDAGNIGVQQIARKYVEECRLMSSLRHPNITLFLGLLFVPNSQLPMLIMEKLDGSLDDLLETVANVPLTLKRSVLEDVARGLLYLHKHNPQVVHRDLTAKNVLLTASFVAKITDFGNSRIVELQPGQLARTLSRLPGTLVYMPPEALSALSHYGPSLDAFSFGVLALFTITQVFPGELLEPNYTDINNVERLVPRTEVERRGRFLEPLERKNHCCLQLIKNCLHNSPSRRPTSEQIVTTLEGMKEHIDGPFGDIARADAVRQVVMMKTLTKTQTVIQEQAGDLAARDEEIQQLQHQLEDAERRHQLEIQQMVAEHEQRVTKIQEHLRQYQDAEQRHQLEIQQKEVEHEQRITAALQEQLHQLQITRETRTEAESAENSGQYQQQRSRPQGGLAEPAVPLDIAWKRVADMPQKMWYNPEAVVVGTKVYVGAGSGENSEAVMEYDIVRDRWSLLPDYDHIWFGMTSAKNKLVLVGGVSCSFDDKRTNRLAVWDESGCVWSHDMPAMPTARSGPSVVTYKDRWMVVAGGYDETNGPLSSVEILDILTGYWHSATSLPVQQYKMSPTIIGSTFYLLAGCCYGVPIASDDTIGIYVGIDDLIYQAVFQSCSPVHWQSLPDIPDSMTLCSALGFNGALLIFGGSSIYIYKSSTSSWIQAGELPRARQGCACAILPNGDIFTAGGIASLKLDGCAVDICTINLQ